MKKNKTKRLIFKKLLLTMLVIFSFIILAFSWIKISHLSFEKSKSYQSKAKESLEKNEFQKAIFDYNEALALNSNDYTRYELGKTYQKTESLEAAKNQYQIIIANSETIFAKPENYSNDFLGNVCFSLGEIYKNQKEYKNAIDSFKKSLTFKKSNKTYSQIGICYLNLKTIDESKPYFERDEESGAYWIGIYNLIKNPDLSVNYFSKSSLSQNQELKKKSDFAKKISQIVITSKNDSYNNLLLGELLFKNDLLELAEEYVQKSIDKESSIKDSWLLMGQIKFKNNLLDEALKDFEKAKLLDPVFGKTYFLIGQTYHKMNMQELADSNYKKAQLLGFVE